MAQTFHCSEVPKEYGIHEDFFLVIRLFYVMGISKKPYIGKYVDPPPPLSHSHTAASANLGFVRK